MYRGGGPLLQDGSRVRSGFQFRAGGDPSGAVRNGQLKAMAMLSKDRWWAAPEVPNMVEAGVPGFYMTFWHAMWLPRGTPKDIVAKLNAAVVAALADPAVRQRFRTWDRGRLAGLAAAPRGARRAPKIEIATWWPIIKASGIKSGVNGPKRGRPRHPATFGEPLHSQPQKNLYPFL